MGVVFGCVSVDDVKRDYKDSRLEMREIKLNSLDS
jgi:hypothetical protein